MKKRVLVVSLSMLLLTSCGSYIELSDGTKVDKDSVKTMVTDELNAQAYSSKEFDEYIDTTFKDKSKNKVKKLVDVDYKEMAKKRLEMYSSQYVGSEVEYKEVLRTYSFTDKEVTYAIENVAIDYNINALQQAQAIVKDTIGTQAYIKDMLIDTYGYTEEQSQYAIDNLSIDWGDALILALKQIKEKVSNISIEDIKAELEKRGFSADEIKYVLDKGINALIDIVF